MNGTVVTAHYKKQGIWTARAYWSHNGIKSQLTVATSDSSAASAVTKAAENIMDSFARDGLATPSNRIDRGNKPAAFVDNYLF